MRNCFFSLRTYIRNNEIRSLKYKTEYESCCKYLKCNTASSPALPTVGGRGGADLGCKGTGTCVGILGVHNSRSRSLGIFFHFFWRSCYTIDHMKFTEGLYYFGVFLCPVGYFYI